MCPSDMISMSDAMLSYGPPQPKSVLWGFATLLPTEYDFPLFLIAPGYVPPQPGCINFQARRHGGRWNVLSCDGHVMGQTTKEFLNPRIGRGPAAVEPGPPGAPGSFRIALPVVGMARARHPRCRRAPARPRPLRDALSGAPRWSKPDAKTATRGSPATHARAVGPLPAGTRPSRARTCGRGARAPFRTLTTRAAHFPGSRPSPDREAEPWPAGRRKEGLLVAARCAQGPVLLWGEEATAERKRQTLRSPSPCAVALAASA